MEKIVYIVVMYQTSAAEPVDIGHDTSILIIAEIQNPIQPLAKAAKSQSQLPRCPNSAQMTCLKIPHPEVFFRKAHR